MTIFVNVKDIIGFVLLVVIVGVAGLILLRQQIKQSRCRHERYHETRSCDAVCNDCGKNLGFIGHLR